MFRKNELFVHSSARVIKSIYKNSSDGVLENIYTLGKFFDNLVFVKNRKSINSLHRVLLLKKAIDCVEIEKIGFNKNFLDYIENSSFLLSFFDELSLENISIPSIKRGDIYAEYEEHLDILLELFNNYKEILEKNRFYCKPSFFEWSINWLFLKNIEKITLYIDGYLSAYEFDVLERVSQKIEINIHINIDDLNCEYYNKRVKKYDLRFESYGKYILNFPKSVEFLEDLDDSFGEVEVYKERSRIAQVGRVYSKISEFVKIKEIPPEEIAIILPSEDFTTYLKLFDNMKNLNFAMGFNLKETKFYRWLNGIYLEFTKKSRDETKNEIFLILASNNPSELFDFISSNIKDKKIEQIVNKEIFLFKKYTPFLDELKNIEILKLFLLELANRKIDDVGSGKIKVMGLLESRDIEFSVAIVVDFNDEFVPKTLDHDMFLNNKIREESNLPTKRDKENLQRRYYKNIFKNSKNIVITFVEDDEHEASKFLYQFGFENRIIDQRCEFYVDSFSQKKSHFSDKIVASFDASTLKHSYSMLKVFSDCKRKFYYRYILNIKKESELAIKRESGTILHSILNSIYTKYSHILDAKELKSEFKKAILDIENREIRFELLLFMRSSAAFFENEIERFSRGYKVYECEYRFDVSIFDLNFCGSIDRVDKRDDEYYLIDYKFKDNINFNKNLQKDFDFQLLLYSLCYKKSRNVEVKSAMIYDLKNGILLEDELFCEKMRLLDELIKEYKSKNIDFSMCELLQRCRYCDYSTLCNRD